MTVGERATIHAALGDAHRLRIVDALRLSDLTFAELAGLVHLPSNAAAHHLGVLEAAGLIDRRVSDGDHRRRYISLRHEPLSSLTGSHTTAVSLVLFVCTHNSARSQFAAALWRERTGGPADSAGNHPAAQVHPKAVRAAATLGIDLSTALPKGYGQIEVTPDLVVSVCDRAREAGMPYPATPSLHWSVPDPVEVGTATAFRHIFKDLTERIDRLAGTQATPISYRGKQEASS